jgi:hypothetical protein
MVETTGTGFPTTRLAAEEFPPPGAGLDTITLSVAVLAKTEAGMETESCVEDLNVDPSMFPLTVTVDVDMNPVPLISTSVAAEPTRMVDGWTDVIEGVGFCSGGVVVFPEALPQPINEATSGTQRHMPKTDRRPKDFMRAIVYREPKNLANPHLGNGVWCARTRVERMLEYAGFRGSIWQQPLTRYRA